ncbi:hypothetical protein [Chroococcidiopsis sp.]|uniref:hypothetical protein n=1 Tax=Chroococcidiopsis sp. TaxID=3088168 RepID=UPI003F363F85
MYLGSADLGIVAKVIVDEWFERNQTNAIDDLMKMNPLQTAYVMTWIMADERMTIDEGYRFRRKLIPVMNIYDDENMGMPFALEGLRNV